MYRFLVSAAHKSSGKTLISIGLAAALRSRGLSVQPFKKGPDYIDPIWLTHAAGRSCRNLDFFLSPEAEIRAQFTHGQDADVCLVEGNKGLYDGLALDGSNSNAALARLLDLPVVLVLDARGQTRGIAPLILGYQAFDPCIRIAGVILNRLGGTRHESKLRTVIEHYTEVPVLGAVQESPQLALVERHLGLMPANEATGADERIRDIAQSIARQVDLDLLLKVTHAFPASLAPNHAGVDSGSSHSQITGYLAPNPVPPPSTFSEAASVRIAIARDAAFGFYYVDDLEALAQAGAKLLFFDSLQDTHLPECDGLFIGGGFPESFLDALSANASLRTDIRTKIEAGLPTIAECGGLMYLAQSITWRGQTRPMVGAIPGDILMHEKPVGRGYVILRPSKEHPWMSPEDGPIHAHEFHYSEIRHLPADTRFAWQVERGHGIDGQRDGIVIHRLLASYSHLRGTFGCPWPSRFVDYVRARLHEHTPKDQTA